jgi:hypothetical protein
VVQTTGTVHEGTTLRYRGSKFDREVCPLKMQCCLLEFAVLRGDRLTKRAGTHHSGNPLRNPTTRGRTKRDGGQRPHLRGPWTGIGVLELGRQIAVDFQADADLDEGRSCPRHVRFLSRLPGHSRLN